MSEELNLVRDLAVILVSAGVFTIISKALKQPPVLGYIIAGLLVGPHISFFPGITSQETVSQWSEIGMIFLMFGLGLEFSFKKLLKVGSSALVAAGTKFIGVFDSYDEALEYVRAGKFPVVLKYDGLAAGKGVVIPENLQEAEEALRDMLLDDRFGKGKVVIEEFLTGPEFSFMCFVDGLKVYPLALSQDHKRAFDGDKGPNTGGMGAYSPLPFISREDEDYAMEHIMKKVAAGMVSEGCPFKGVLYGGLMKTPDGIKVIEFNCRFGDPETEVVLPRLETDIYLMFSAVADSDSSMPPVKWADNVVLGFVMASKGYPGSYEKGFEISGLEDAMSDPAVRIYQMGTKFAEVEGRESPVLVTSGGRVLMVVAAAPTALEARDKALAAVGKIRCANLFNRTDIGHWIF